MLDREEIESMNKERAKYEIFKESYLRTKRDFSFYNSIEGSSEYAWLMSDIAFVGEVMKGDLAKTGWIGCNKDKESYSEINMYYSSLLDKTKRLALELGLTNSLEISNLFSYLLWNGYFSKTKSNICTHKDNKGIYGLRYIDIIEGKCTQVSNSEMLKDLLNSCDFAATDLFNTISNKDKFDIVYKVPIERQIAETSSMDKMKLFILSPFVKAFTKKMGNSSFVLIREDDKVYIYDPTILSIFEVNDSFNANLINGSGTTQLHPYMSFPYFKDMTREMIAIDGLFELDDLSSPYNREDFIFTSNGNIESFNNNIHLLDDFYADIDVERRKISKISDRLVRIKK